ncbi:MAG: hypothetical protein R2751_13395 [Bacteroidales bacterium]
MIRALGLVCCLGMLLVHGPAGGQEPARAGLCLMWYNVENLFHPDDDSLGADDPYTPEGEARWTEDRYRRKLDALAKVIVAAGRWEGPEVVGLCEVENRRVLEDLARHPLLRPENYSVVHREGPDHRGMDVACLYRSDRLRLMQCGWYSTGGGEGLEETRDLLHLRFCLAGRDTFDLLLAHLISKYRGAGSSAEPRRRQALRLIGLADSLAGRGGGSAFFLMGDLNDERTSFALESLRSRESMRDRVLGGESKPVLTYKYRGRWSALDQVHVLGLRAPWQGGVHALALPALLEEDLLHSGLKPYRCYEGFRYRGGLSDHLPLVLDLRPPGRETGSPVQTPLPGR